MVVTLFNNTLSTGTSPAFRIGSNARMWFRFGDSITSNSATMRNESIFVWEASLDEGTTWVRIAGVSQRQTIVCMLSELYGWPVGTLVRVRYLAAQASPLTLCLFSD